MSHGDKSSHNDNRKKVCAPCGAKIKFGNSKPKKFLINEKIAGLVQKFSSKFFNASDERYPLGICGSCQLILYEFDKGKFTRRLQPMPNYSDLVLLKETRSSNTCNCYICSTGRHKGHMKTISGRGHLKHLNNKIDNPTKVPKSSVGEQMSIPAKIIKKPSESIQLCKKCWQETKRGITHTCGGPVENILSIVENLPDKVQENIAAHVIKRKCDSIIEGTGKMKNVNLALSTGGRKTRLLINPEPQKSIQIKEEHLDNYRTKMGVSANNMKKFTYFLRSEIGRKSVPKNYNQTLSKKSKILADVYKTGIYEFECEKNIGKKQKRPVVYTDAEELVDAVIEKRNLQGNYVIKVMADGGQGFFKISLTILPENYSDDQLELEDPNECGKRRCSTYADGGSFKKKPKLSSVHQLIMLCVVPQIKESYENMKLLFDLTNINNIPFKFVADFKLLLIINGQQTASATFPCPYCFISLNSLRGSRTSLKNSNVDNGIHSANDDDSANEEDLKLKTYGDLKTDYEKYCLTGNDKKFSKDCHSTINPPLFHEEDHICILEKCIIPELHILQGFVNHLFWQGLVKLLGEEKALLWPTRLNLISKNYHGNAFEGNACRKLLQEADKLNDPDISGHVNIFEIIPYITAFKAMNKIVDCCFTSGKVKPSLDTHLQELDAALKSIDGLSETLKIHVLLAHVKEGLQFIGDNNGLGYWSEQSGEAIHHNFMEFWNRYKVKNIYHETYEKNLFKAVIEFSSLHL